jgi:hypothetical protein
MCHWEATFGTATCLCSTVGGHQTPAVGVVANRSEAWFRGLYVRRSKAQGTRVFLHLNRQGAQSTPKPSPVTTMPIWLFRRWMG